LECLELAVPESGDAEVGRLTLRDQFGEVEVGIGDFFKLGDAKLGVICQNPDQTICCRVYEGLVSVDYEAEDYGDDGSIVNPGRVIGLQSVIDFLPEEVASGVREYRLLTFDIQPAPVEQTPAKSQPKAPSARPSKKRAEQHGPTTGSLF
jgi:hypothetical protein